MDNNSVGSVWTIPGLSRLIRALSEKLGLSYWLVVILLIAWVISGLQQVHVIYTIVGTLGLLVAAITGHLVVYYFPIESRTEPQAVLHSLSRLNEDDQLLLIMRHREDWGHGDIASALRAFQKLHKKIDKKLIEERCNSALRKLAKEITGS